MTGNVLKEIEENISVYEEQGLELIPLSLVKYWINVLGKENKQLKQYKKAIFDCDSSKIIRVNGNTGEVDLIDKELKKG